MVGNLVRSIAGHDRDKIYIVIEETEKGCMVSDGRLKPLASPKYKNKKHLQQLGSLSSIESNEAIKRSIRSFRRTMNV